MLALSTRINQEKNCKILNNYQKLVITELVNKER
jgi:hypothetical protein